jgi:hypothetical protein
MVCAAMTRRVAEVGATAKEIASVSGHKLREIQRYTDQADQRQLAGAAMKTLGMK